ncbi:hypothetical protein VTO73DRAFT_8980 [Trametes versicolor]
MQMQGAPSTFFSAAALPHEILLEIFTKSTPPPHEYDPSIIQGSNSSWLRQCLRTKKSLPLVCRAWNPPATEVLYSDIVFRRVGQIVALAETLGWMASDICTTQEVGPPSERDLATLIKRIRIDSLIVISPCSDAIPDGLAYVFARCTRLVAFDFQPHPAFRIHDDTNILDEFSPGWMFGRTHVDFGGQHVPPDPVVDAFRTRLRSGIRELDLMSTQTVFLDWECDETAVRIHHVLRSAASTLVVLKLGALDVVREETVNNLCAVPLVFPVLEELHICPGSLLFSDYVSRGWVLPRLTRLTMVRCRMVWPDNLLAAHGQRLQYLHVFPTTIDTPRHTTTAIRALQPATLIVRCPQLLHLVLPALLREPLQLRHPSLRYLDVWSQSLERILASPTHGAPKDPGAAVRAAVLDESQCTLPALRGVRVLLAAHLATSNTHREWPLVCHPEALLRGNSAAGPVPMRYHMFSSAWVVQTAWGVLSLDNPFFRGRRSAVLANMGFGSNPGDEDGSLDGELDEGTDEEDLLDGLQPGQDALRAVLEEQGLAYSDTAADANYVPLEEESESDSDSGEWDDTGSSTEGPELHIGDEPGVQPVFDE